VKSLLTTFLIVSFIGVAVFGTFGMDQDGQSHSHGCIASIAFGVDCPVNADPIDFASFHLDAFRTLSLTTFGENVMSALLLMFVSLLFIGYGILSRNLFEPLPFAFSKQRFHESFSSQTRKLSRWLARHENSPAIV